MREFLLSLTVLAGAVVGVGASAANAAPRFVVPVPAVSDAALVQPVQYYEDWRYNEWRRREEFERFRRHDEWHHERHEAREHEEREHEHRGW